jgi:protein-tyrosine phosphatase
MIDLHTHLLVGLDDGAKDFEHALGTLERMIADGVTDAVVTPHFIRGSYETSRSTIDAKLAELREAAAEKQLQINLHPGAEILISPDTVKDVTTQQLVLANGSFVLVECEINSIPPNLLDVLYKLNVKGYRPILAHPERYSPYAEHPSQIEDLVHRNTYLQINAQSLLGGYGRRVAHVAWKLVEDGLAHFVASDTHCHGDNYPLKAAADAITERIDRHTADLLTTINPAKLLAGEEIEYTYVRLIRESHRSNRPRNFLQKLGDALWNR